MEGIGAEALLVPLIELAPPASWDELDAAIRSLAGSGHDFDWVIFTSANAVRALAGRASALGVRLAPERIAAVGPATAKAVAAAGLQPLSGPVLVPDRYVAEALAEALLKAVDLPQRFLLVRAEEARDVLRSALEAAGHIVHIAAAYRNVTPHGTLSALRDLFDDASRHPEVITFTSSSTARNLISLLEEAHRKMPEGVALASIGPITSATLRELGYEPTFEAAEPTIASLTAAVAKHLKL